MHESLEASLIRIHKADGRFPRSLDKSKKILGTLVASSARSYLPLAPKSMMLSFVSGCSQDVLSFPFYTSRCDLHACILEEGAVGMIPRVT